jgi:hypothetical protein
LPLLVVFPPSGLPPPELPPEQQTRERESHTEIATLSIAFIFNISEQKGDGVFEARSGKMRTGLLYEPVRLKA